MRGFTLIEMAISLAVIVLLLGSLLVPLVTQTEQRQVGETQKALNDIKEALIGYALTQSPAHLPCPDKIGGGGAGTANDGIEDFDAATGTCVVQDGNLPWATLGVAEADPWGNRFRYVVHSTYSNRPPSTTLLSLNPSPASNLQVCTTSACTTTLATQVPAIILSHGKNGLGAISANTGAANAAPSTADEIENTNLNQNLVSRVASGAGSGAGEFDDIVAWLPASILFSRLVAAGKLP